MVIEFYWEIGEWDLEWELGVYGGVFIVLGKFFFFSGIRLFIGKVKNLF